LGSVRVVQDAKPSLEQRLVVEQEGMRLDRVVAQLCSISRRVARTYITAGRVRLNGKPTKILTLPLRVGAIVQVLAPGPETPTVTGGMRVRRGSSNGPARSAGYARRVEPARRTEPAGRVESARHADRPTKAAPADALRVVFCDRYLIVIDKPAGLLSEHDRFGSPSLESIVPALLRGRGERDRVWLAHRLDAGTSGVIAMARTPMAAAALGEAFRAGTVRKTYLALCSGRVTEVGVIDAPIARAQGTRHAVHPSGKPARTAVTILAQSSAATLVGAEPKTGRTHQIRVHLQHLGHPLFGDGLYGGPTYTTGPLPEPIGRPMLHAAVLRLAHPKTHAPLVLIARPPPDFVVLATRLGLDLEAATRAHGIFDR